MERPELKGIGESSSKVEPKSILGVYHGRSEDNTYPAKRACITAPEHAQTHDQKYVFPWKGILANVKRNFDENKKTYFGDSGRDMKEELTVKGFNPHKVEPLWNSPIGHTGFAIVEFGKERVGFENAISFEKHFDVNQCGKREYAAAREGGDKLYAWVAKEEDYHSKTIIGFHLRKDGVLTSVQEKEAEDQRMALMVVSDLKNTLETKKSILQQMESKCKAAEDMLRLAEKQKRETEELCKKVNEFQQKRFAQQALELEIEKRRGELAVMGHMVQGNGDPDMKKIIEKKKEELKEKDKEWEQQESIRENLLNDELEDASMAVTNAMKELTVAPELWNFNEGKKATLEEGVDNLINLWKQTKNNRS